MVLLSGSAGGSGKPSDGTGKPSGGAEMSSEEVGRASQRAIFVLLKALEAGNRETKKNICVFYYGSSRGHYSKTITR